MSKKGSIQSPFTLPEDSLGFGFVAYNRDNSTLTPGTAVRFAFLSDSQAIIIRNTSPGPLAEALHAGMVLGTILPGETGIVGFFGFVTGARIASTNANPGTWMKAGTATFTTQTGRYNTYATGFSSSKGAALLLSPVTTGLDQKATLFLTTRRR